MLGNSTVWRSQRYRWEVSAESTPACPSDKTEALHSCMCTNEKMQQEIRDIVRSEGARYLTIAPVATALRGTGTSLYREEVRLIPV